MNNTATKYWSDYPDLLTELDFVHEIMKNSVKCRDKGVEAILTDMIDSGGKLLRPAFLIISSKFGRLKHDKIYSLAAVIELLHMSTLIHDDIVDEAPIRRGKITIQSEYGKNNAVLLGDFLLTRCLDLLSNKTSMKNMRLVSKVISQICLGEIEQFSSRYYNDVSVRKYIRRIASKTAALFSLSCFIGAHESKCSKKLILNLSKVGYYIGMAFQVIDDILDYSGNAQVVGKALGHDLRQGTFTFPLIYSIRQNSEELNSILAKKDYTDADIQRIIQIAKETGGIDKAKGLAARYTTKAFKHIEKLPDNENKEAFLRIAQDLLLRDY